MNNYVHDNETQYVGIVCATEKLESEKAVRHQPLHCFTTQRARARARAHLYRTINKRVVRKG